MSLTGFDKLDDWRKRNSRRKLHADCNYNSKLGTQSTTQSTTLGFGGAVSGNLRKSKFGRFSRM
jgi:hypothetical protein